LWWKDERAGVNNSEAPQAGGERECVANLKNAEEQEEGAGLSDEATTTKTYHERWRRGSNDG